MMEAIWCACYSTDLSPLNDDTCSIATNKWDDVSIATDKRDDAPTLDVNDPTDAKKNEYAEVEKIKRKSILLSVTSLLSPMAARPTAQDITIDEMRDDATSLIHQTMPTSGNDLAPDQVNYLSKMKKWIMDNAGEANSAMEERDGAESAMESKNSAGDLIADVDNGGRECNEVKDLVPDTGKCAKFGSPKLAYLQSRVKSASSKKGVLIVEDEKSVITTPTSPFTGVIMTAKANMKKTRMTKVDNNAKFKHFQVVLSGYKSTDMMVRLPYDRNATFQDLRRELEEDYADDFPSSDFRFTLTADGISVSPMQEEKWRVRDYVLTNQGGDGTFKNPHHVYMKSIKKGKIMKS
jgi:hypothetical protein